MKDKKRISKKRLIIAGVIFLILAVGLLFFRLVIGGDEDTWIKDERGVYVKHGNPSETPGYVLWQQAIIKCALDKFEDFTGELDSQCVGVCLDYAVDIVHVPRISTDNEISNQCQTYTNGEISHFIELDKYGNVVRLV